VSPPWPAKGSRESTVLIIVTLNARSWTRVYSLQQTGGAIVGTVSIVSTRSGYADGWARRWRLRAPR